MEVKAQSKEEGQKACLSHLLEPLFSTLRNGLSGPQGPCISMQAPACSILSALGPLVGVGNTGQLGKVVQENSGLGHRQL